MLPSLSLSFFFSLSLLCPPCTNPSTSSRLREVLAFELLPCHLLLCESREMIKDHRLGHTCPSIQPSIHPSIHKARSVTALLRPCSLQGLDQEAKSSTVSKAARPSRHSNKVIWNCPSMSHIQLIFSKTKPHSQQLLINNNKKQSFFLHC